MALLPIPANIPWKAIGIALAALMAVAAVWFSIDAYGDARYDAGQAKADADWKAAAEKLEEQSEEAGQKAETGAIEREAEYVERLEEEKERIDDAVREGDSPLDVLFGDGGV